MQLQRDATGGSVSEMESSALYLMKPQWQEPVKVVPAESDIVR